MRVVFDTNVLISAHLDASSLPAMTLAMARHGDTIKSVTSPVLLDELSRVLRTKFRAGPDLAEGVVSTFAEYSEMVRPEKTLHVITNDPSDNRLLECAVEGKAQVIVTGDRHLLILKNFRGIRIMTVREFFDSIHNA